MLDTNMVSHLIKEHPVVTRHVLGISMAQLCISAITAAELTFGLAKRPNAIRLHNVVREFLKRVDVLPWDNLTAECHGIARAALEQSGKILAPLDLLIATHALTCGATLVTNDRAFQQLTNLQLEDWTHTKPTGCT